MSVAPIPRVEDSETLSQSRGQRSRGLKVPGSRKLWIGVAAGLAVVLITGFFFVRSNWPYRYGKIHPLLEDVLSSNVRISAYHRTYFPHPGFVAIGLTMRRKSAPDLPPLGSVEKMVVQGRWTDLLLLRQRVETVEISNLHLEIPPPGSRASQEDFPPGSAQDFDGPDTAIENLIVYDSLLDIMRDDGGRWSFPIHQLSLRDFAAGHAMSYNVDMGNARPRGEIRARGSFGPIQSKNLAATPVSGEFTFTSVALHDVGDIRGTLSSTGRFRGTLGAMEAEADSTTPDFAVGDGKATGVAGSIQCTVNGLNGDLAIHAIEAKSGSTVVRAAGAIAGSPKVTNLDIEVKKGSAEDVLRPFMRHQIPIVGPVRLRSHAYIGPAAKGVGFLDRLRVDGVFDVPKERLTDEGTQKNLTAFSERAQDKDGHSGDSSSDALSSIKGPAQIRNGVISSQQLVFQIPGAEAKLRGTFTLHGQAVHLLGDLKMQSDISHTATGFKSFLLKPLAPFFKKQHAGAVVPIAVTGSSGHYAVSQDIAHKK